MWTTHYEVYYTPGAPTTSRPFSEFRKVQRLVNLRARKPSSVGRLSLSPRFGCPVYSNETATPPTQGRDSRLSALEQGLACLSLRKRGPRTGITWCGTAAANVSLYACFVSANSPSHTSSVVLPLVADLVHLRSGSEVDKKCKAAFSSRIAFETISNS